jgi:site-specific DNA-cytosine methylase
MSNQLLQYLIVSLFSGWGGGDSGFHKAFFKTLLAVDNNRNSRENFKLNFPGVDVQDWDLMTVKAAFILNYLGLKQLAIDVLLMSPPCTGVSKAGKCDPYHPLNRLYLRSIKSIIPGLLPRVFLIENVPMEGDMLVLYNLIQNELEKLKGEYHIEEGILNSIDFGSPQSRKRFFILGVHKSLGVMPSFPEPTTPLLSQQKRIMDVLPTVDGIAYGYGWAKFKHKSEQLNTMTKTPNFVPVYNGVNGEFTKREVLDMCGYDTDWKTTGSFIQVWNRAGNSIMPHVSIAWAEHIRDNILGKADGTSPVLHDNSISPLTSSTI